MNEYRCAQRGGGTVAREQVQISPTMSLCKRQLCVSNKTPKFRAKGPAVTEICKNGTHVRTCRCAPLVTSLKRIANGSLTTHRIENNASRRSHNIPKRERDAHVRTCSRTPTHELRKPQSEWSPNHTPRFSAMYPAVPETRRRGTSRS